LNPTVFETPAALFDSLAEAVRRILVAAQSARGEASIVLAGGTTPAAVYRRLGENPGAVDPRRVGFFWGDERWAPVDDPQRNERLARQTWLAPWGVPETNVHPLIDRLDDPRAAAQRADGRLARQPDFDLVLLGVGEDGHTASLFPGHSVNPNAQVIAVLDAPKPPPVRLTLTPRALARGRSIFVLAAGEEKSILFRRLRNGEKGIPVAPFLDLPGTRLFVDRAAWGSENLPSVVNKS
jgi:6-phosphogluconolactonase